MDIGKKKPALTPTRQQEKRTKRRTIIGWIAFGIIVGTFLYIMNHPYTQVKDIQIHGQRTLFEEDIIIKVNEYLDQKYLWIIPKSNIILLDSRKVENYLKHEFPKIKEIVVEINDGDTLFVDIGERRAHSLWCVDQVYASEFDEECYFADQTGLLYTRAPYFSGNVYLKLYYDEHRDPALDVGVQVLDTDFDMFFNFLEGIEDEYNMKIYRVIFADYSDVRIELARVYNQTYNDRHPYIIFNQSDDLITVMRNLNVTLDFDTFKKDFTEQSEKLESIDVRFGDRVFYSFSDEVYVDPQLTESTGVESDTSNNDSEANSDQPLTQ